MRVTSDLPNIVPLRSINPAPPGVFPYPRLPGGGGGRIRTPPVISKTVRRSEKDEAAFERTRRFVPKKYLKFYDRVQLSGQGQVKGQILTFLRDEA